MIVLEALGELVEVLGCSRIGQEGRKITKCGTCQRFGASLAAITPPGPAPKMLQVGSGGCSRKPRVRVFNH